MQQELDKEGKFTELLAASYFKIFLLKTHESLYPNYNPQEDGDRHSKVVRSFKVNLEQHIQALLDGQVAQLHQVVDFVDLQQLHPNYFSTVIKTKTGQTVSEWIAAKVIQEAKSQLSKSTASIKEIAFQYPIQRRLFPN